MRIAPIALALLVATSAAAQTASTPEAKAEAQERYERALKLADIAGTDRQLLEGALAEFQAAWKLFPAAPILFNVAVTQRKLGLRGEALRTFERYLAEAGEIAPERRAAVEEEIREIRSQVAEVRVVVAGGPAELWVDGRAIGSTPLADALFLLPGTHTFKAVRQGAIPAEKQLEVLSGKSYDLALSPVAPRHVASLSVTTSPSDANLFLDGRPLGRAPWRGEIEPGGYALTAELEGYDPAREQLILGAGQTREISMELVQPTPLYKKWWFWTALGVVAAGAGASVYVATLPTVDQRITLP